MSEQSPLPRQFAPDAYRAQDPAAIVRAYPFAALTTATAQGIHATQTPVFFEHDDSTDTVVGHMARRNPHAGVLATGQAALVLFTGPHAYVSGRWYKDEPQVPTWDYVSAQLRGTLEVLDEEAAQRAVLSRSAALLEPDDGSGWSLESAPAGRVARLLPMIRSFRIRVETLEGVTKLTQTHPRADQLRVAEALDKERDTQSIAEMIRALPQGD